MAFAQAKKRYALNLSKTQIRLITTGILLSLFLASMEGTVVSTAMPTIVGQLGGLSIYSWVFSIYMLTSTTTVPIYGKLSDLYGRKRIYSISMLLFLAGSILCGQARSMEQLIVFRAVQGLGAGGVLPLAFTIIGELFSLEQRARMQGLFSGVWGVSSIVGPLIGGFLVDQVSWQWVFYINAIPGLLAVGLVVLAWQEVEKERRKVSVDYLGALFLTLAALGLLLGLDQPATPLGIGLLASAAALSAALLWVERRAADPILPLGLFHDRLFVVAMLNGIFAGWAMFGSISYVPLFVQAVLGTSATQAGITLTPMSLAWTASSVVSSNLLLTMGYRTLALAGSLLLVVGCVFMALITPATSTLLLMIYLGTMGVGMGLVTPAFLIAVQSTVQRRDLGIATSTLQFSRSIGGTLGVSVLGVFLASRLAANLAAAGVDPASVSIDSLMDPAAGASAALNNGALRDALGGAVASLFVVALVAAVLGLAVVFFAPGGKIAQLKQAPAANPQQD
jgi:EmrB/QacA subfamily drug resistance transporter